MSSSDEPAKSSSELAKSDDAPVKSTTSRALRNEIERRSRRKRQQRKREMLGRVRTLESVLRSLRLELTGSPADPSAAAGECEHHDGRADRADESHMRLFVRQSLSIARETARLKNERRRLEKDLQDRRELESRVRTAMAVRWAHWDDGLEGWNTITHAIYEPWARESIAGIVKDSLHAIRRFSDSTDRVSSGHKFMGWSDSRRLDEETSRLQFSFSKSFVQTDPAVLFEAFWEMQFSGEKLRRYNLGYSTKVHVEVLQKISSDIVIVRRDAQYSGITTRFHTVLLMFRQRTPKGFMACMRTIPAPSIERAIEGDAAWMNQFHWTHIDYVPDSEGQLTGCRLSFCGSLSSENTKYAHRWMLELAMVLVRGENTMIGPRLIQS